MDVVSSAVGIASLGIQVCQGLLSYYKSWKSYSTDITRACQYVDDLKQTFELLEVTLPQQERDPAGIKRAEECLALCTDGLNDLENIWPVDFALFKLGPDIGIILRAPNSVGHVRLDFAIVFRGGVCGYWMPEC